MVTITLNCNMIVKENNISFFYDMRMLKILMNKTSSTIRQMK